MKSICILFLFFSTFNLFSQEFVRSFNANRAEFLSDSMIMTYYSYYYDRQSERFLNDNQILFYQQKDDSWVVKDTLNIDDYMPGYFLTHVTVSNDGNVIAAYLEKKEDFTWDKTDFIIILKKVDEDWTMINVFDNLRVFVSWGNFSTKVDFSDDGSSLIYSYTTYEFGGHSEGITTFFYTYSQSMGRYVLVQQNYVDQDGSDDLYQYLDHQNTLWINQSYYNNEKFIKYEAIDGIWHYTFSEPQRPSEQYFAGKVLLDESGSQLIRTIGYALGDIPSSLQLYAIDNNDYELTDEISLSPYLQGITLERNDSCTYLTAGYYYFSFDVFPQEYDTISYVDYLAVKDGKLKRLHRFSFPIPEFDLFHANAGYTYNAKISPKGDQVLINYGISSLRLYDMSNLIDDASNTSITPKIYPNPSTDFIFLTDLPFTTLKLYNVSGQYIEATYTPQYLDVSSLPAGVYFLDADTTHGQRYTYKIIKI